MGTVTAATTGAPGLSNTNITTFPDVQAGHHPWFYFEDGTIVLEIQTTLFKVHRHFLTEHSPVFKDMWTLGSSVPNNGEGSSDDNPISLNGDEPGDFSCLLQLFYHKSPGSAVSFSAVQWCSVLAIATKYDMEIIRRNAIEALKLANPPLDPIDQIVAARRYHCAELVEAPMGVLVKRTGPLLFDEILKLSPEDLHSWITRRDESPGGSRGIPTGYCYNCGMNY